MQEFAFCHTGTDIIETLDFHRDTDDSQFVTHRFILG